MKMKLLVWCIVILAFQNAAYCQPKTITDTKANLIAYYTRLPFDDNGFPGKYADVIVKVKDKGYFVFSRQHSYQPYWHPKNGKLSLVDRLIERAGDGPSERPDKNNICSNVSIVERTPESVTVHWRYAPDMMKAAFMNFTEAYNKVNNPSPFYAEYADEYFTIYSSGAVTRTAKKGCYSLDDWTDTKNQFTQKFNLTASGIIQQILILPAQQKLTSVAIKGEIVKNSPIKKPLLHFSFNEALARHSNRTTEHVTKTSLTVSGTKAYWRKGISGTCLSFDSYSNAVLLPASKAPVLKSEFTLEACIAPQEYPIGTAAIIEHIDKSDGYSLGLDAKGTVEFKAVVDTDVIILKSGQVPLYKWSHIIANYSVTNGLSIYINGTLAVNKPVKGNFKDAVNADISIGMTRSSAHYLTGAERQVTKGFATHIFFSGLIDEIKVFDRNLSPKEITAQYLALKPLQLQPFKPWLLPDSPENPNGFGAMNVNLTYSPECYGLWRVGKYSDIVVTFKDKPWRYVFWRGTRYLPSLVTDYGKEGRWSSDQSPEHYSVNVMNTCPTCYAATQTSG